MVNGRSVIIFWVYYYKFPFYLSYFFFEYSSKDFANSAQTSPWKNMYILCIAFQFQERDYDV